MRGRRGPRVGESNVIYDKHIPISSSICRCPVGCGRRLRAELLFFLCLSFIMCHRHRRNRCTDFVCRTEFVPVFLHCFDIDVSLPSSNNCQWHSFKWHSNAHTHATWNMHMWQQDKPHNIYNKNRWFHRRVENSPRTVRRMFGLRLSSLCPSDTDPYKWCDGTWANRLWIRYAATLSANVHSPKMTAFWPCWVRACVPHGQEIYIPLQSQFLSIYFSLYVTHSLPSTPNVHIFSFFRLRGDTFGCSFVFVFIFGLSMNKKPHIQLPNDIHSSLRHILARVAYTFPRLCVRIYSILWASHKILMARQWPMYVIIYYIVLSHFTWCWLLAIAAVDARTRIHLNDWCSCHRHNTKLKRTTDTGMGLNYYAVTAIYLLQFDSHSHCRRLHTLLLCHSLVVSQTPAFGFDASPTSFLQFRLLFLSAL